MSLAATGIALAPYWCDASAQGINPPWRATSIVTARLEVAAISRIELRGAPVVVAERTDYTELTVPTWVSANFDWSLSLGGADHATPTEVLAIRDADGEWIRPEPGRRVVIVRRGMPANSRPVELRLRVRRGAAQAGVSQLRLVLMPVE